jgi:hypothetical protein
MKQTTKRGPSGPRFFFADWELLERGEGWFVSPVAVGTAPDSRPVCLVAVYYCLKW